MQLFQMMDQHPIIQELKTLLPQMRGAMSQQTQTDHPDLQQTQNMGMQPGGQPGAAPAASMPGIPPAAMPGQDGMEQANYSTDPENEVLDMTPEQYSALTSRVETLEKDLGQERQANQALVNRLAEVELAAEDNFAASVQKEREAFIRGKYQAIGDELFDVEVTVAKYANLEAPVSQDVWDEFANNTEGRAELIAQYSAQNIPDGQMPAAPKNTGAEQAARVHQRAQQLYDIALNQGSVDFSKTADQLSTHFQQEAENEILGVQN